MKKNYKVKLIFILLFFASVNVNATHIMGSDITYQSLGGKRYNVIVKIYRDCRGIPLSTIDIMVSTNNGCSSGIRLPVNRIGIRNITDFCPGTKPPCVPINTNRSGKGVEEHTFEGTIDLADPKYNKWAAAGCCEVYFNWSLCCRNGAITTGQQSQLFFSYAMLNMCNLDSFSNATNSTPTMSNVPVAYICCNQPYYFNNGCYDNVDYDSLAYELENPLGANRWDNLQYQTPLNVLNPMTSYCPSGSKTCSPNPKAAIPEGFFLDKLTGDVIFTPTNCSEVGIVVVGVREYRKTKSGNKLLVGVIRRDMQLIVENCALNSAPILTGPNDTIICIGQTVCFDINSFDPNGDTIDLTWNKGIIGGNFTVLNPNDPNKKAKFCWTPGNNVVQNRAYSFTAKAVDDYCPRSASSVKSYTIVVSDRPPFKLAPTSYLDSCHENAIISASGSSQQDFYYTWNLPGGIPSQLSGVNLKGPLNVKYLTQGTHPIYLDVKDMFGFGCTLNDTAQVEVVCNVLPLELHYFDAQYTNNRHAEIKANWTTSQEYDLLFYKVQWSKDNINFITADTLIAVNHSNELHHYTSTFLTTLPENNEGVYVRLLEHNSNGEDRIISKTVYLDRAQMDEITIYPIPYKNGQSLNISLAKGAKEVNIVDLNGKLVFHTISQTSKSQINLGNLSIPQGIYTISIDKTKRKLLVID